mmetsp:Transcript_29757/g.98694  ORF Transcript_29757/g.98694 Transcript_29757/m.98694 type:complete len:93 (+) Transcript_29757:2216-2494(+)
MNDCVVVISFTDPATDSATACEARCMPLRFLSPELPEFKVVAVLEREGEVGMPDDPASAGASPPPPDGTKEETVGPPSAPATAAAEAAEGTS